LKDGGVWCWGRNYLGQLGNNSRVDSLVPVAVSGLEEGVSSITTGAFHTCALKGGGVMCWGSGYTGELGNNDRNDGLVPVAVSGMERGVTAIRADGGGETAAIQGDGTCALKDGGVWCWGARAGELAGTGTMESLAPVAVPGLASGVSAISGNCALKDGQWWCRGTAWKFVRTADSSLNRPVPAPIPGLGEGFSEITELGVEYACAIKDGGLWCWIAGALAEVRGFESGVSAISVSGGIGLDEYVCVLKDGRVWCWRANFFMNIVTTPPEPVVMAGLEGGVSAINGTCAVKDGGVWCWGDNSSGQLGNSDSPESLVPVAVQFPP
jgi:hypothetical protein